MFSMCGVEFCFQDEASSSCPSPKLFECWIFMSTLWLSIKDKNNYVPYFMKFLLCTSYWCFQCSNCPDFLLDNF